MEMRFSKSWLVDLPLRKKKVGVGRSWNQVGGGGRVCVRQHPL